MSRTKSRAGWVYGALSVALGASLLAGRAGIAAETEPEKTTTVTKEAAPPAATPPAPATPAFSGKLTKPWSDLPSLSDEQKAKLYEIHHKALAKQNEIEKQEKADSMAVLTDAQKAELKTAMSKDRKDAAARSLARKASAASATTQPAK